MATEVTATPQTSEERPLLDSRLPDGSRVAAALPPVSLGGTTLTIRKFHSRHFAAEELVQIGTQTREHLAILEHAIQTRDNILISGGTGTGKTTLLNALAAFLPPEDRLVLIAPFKSMSLLEELNNQIKICTKKARFIINCTL